MKKLTDNIELQAKLEEAREPIPDKHLLVLDEYLFNGRMGQMAWQSVYPNAKSFNSGAKQFWDLKQKPEVKKYLRAYRDCLIEELRVDKNYIIDEYMQIIACAKNSGDLTNWNRALKSITEMLALDEPRALEVNHKMLPLFPENDDDLDV